MGSGTLLDRDSGCEAGTVPSRPGEEGRILAFCSAHLRLIQEASAALLTFLLSYSGLGLYDSTSPFRQKWLRLKMRMPGLRVSNGEAFHKILESPKTPWPGFFAQMMNHGFLQPVVLDVLV